MTRLELDGLHRMTDAANADDADISSFGTATQRFARVQGRNRPAPHGLVMTERLRRRVSAHDLPGEVVLLAWELIRLAPDLTPGETRGLLYVITVVLLDLRRGSTRTPVEGPAGRRHLAGHLDTLVPDAEERGQILQNIQWVLEQDRAPAVIGKSPDAYVPLTYDDGHLYMQRMLRLETRLVDMLFDRVRCDPPAAAADAAGWLAEVVSRPALLNGEPVRLSDEQEAAVQSALTQRLTVISGGPGTGKTSVVVALLRALVRAGVGADEVALAAPTGKAAHRMAQAIRQGLEAVDDPSPEDAALAARVPEPSTLHRLLGYRPGSASFAHHENNPLSERVVVIDESSMIDLEMMERLARAVRPDARLILLGDAEQLPSIDAGAVLRDVRAAHRGMTVQLTKSYRMRDDDPDGRAILVAAQAVNRGDAAAILGTGEGDEGSIPRFEHASALPFRGVAFLASERPVAATHALVARWDRRSFTEEVRQASRRMYHFRDGAFRPQDTEHLDTLEAIANKRKLLCVTRSAAFATGAETINALIHQRRAAAEGLDDAPDLLAGEPIMMTHNDYQRRLFNGDQGVVVRVAVDQEVATDMAVFRTDRGFEPFALAQLRPHLTLAHALTVHKAQGSEMDEVAILLPEMDLPLLTREILYTAMTRARRSVTLVGHPELMARGIRRVMERHSGVAHRLAARLSAPETP